MNNVWKLPLLKDEMRQINWTQTFRFASWMWLVNSINFGGLRRHHFPNLNFLYCVRPAHDCKTGPSYCKRRNTSQKFLKYMMQSVVWGHFGLYFLRMKYFQSSLYHGFHSASHDGKYLNIPDCNAFSVSTGHQTSSRQMQTAHDADMFS